MSHPTSSTHQGRVDPIAIVGVGCRLPGGVNEVQDLVAFLRDRRSGIATIPSDRWDVDAFYDPDPLAPGKTYCRHGGFIQDIDRFDAAFFGISDGEAARMDPQQRLVLETMWHALEDAGQAADELAETDTGVFLAMMNTNGYALRKARLEGNAGVTGYDSMADSMAITAGRISHFLGAQGPCMSVDTACSGSLLAVHLARQSILAGECDTAIVVGVNAIVDPTVNMAFSKVGLMSSSGQCHAFDEAADGYVRGEGCMVVILRRQSEALERGDRILASVVGSATNQDGRTPALTAPNGQMQEKVMRRALARAGVDAGAVGYVESHGTGTPVGDPIEMSAISNVFGPQRTGDDPLWVGSVKTNFGHLESAAGALGLVKAALSLDRETIFPNQNFNQLNPSIRLVGDAVRIPTEPVPWPRTDRPRMAGVNSFGYSGTNVHVVLQEAPPVTQRAEHAARPSQVVLLSAKSGAALQDVAERWSTSAASTAADGLDDVAFTAGTGRAVMRHRLAVVGTDLEDVGAKIGAWREGRQPKGLVAGQPSGARQPKVAFVFSGQGTQHAHMGRQLYEVEVTFRDAIDQCAQVMDAELGRPLQEIMFEAPDELLRDTRYAQPTLFALEYALSQQLRDWGIDPDVVIGHSIGEIVAACVAGAIDLEGAARFVLARGRLMGELPAGGSMLAVAAPEEAAADWLAGRDSELSLAAVNGPSSIVIAGRAEAVAGVAELAQTAGFRSTALQVSHAFHSPLMDPALDELGEVAASVRTSPPAIPVVSNVTGRVMDDPPDAAYWVTHARHPVRFWDGMEAVLDAGCSVLVEVGPHPALLPGVAGALDTTRTRMVPTLRRDNQDVDNILEAIGALFVSGVPVNRDRLFWGSSYRRVPLPLYPFRRERHWLDEPELEAPMELPSDLHPLLGRAVSASRRQAVFEVALSASIPWGDHRVLGSTVFPATGYLEMVARGVAARVGEPWTPVTLKDVHLERPIQLAYDSTQEVALRVEGPADALDAATFAVTSGGNGKGPVYCRGSLGPADEQDTTLQLAAEVERMDAALGLGPFYGQLRHSGLEYGFAFATVREVWTGPPGSGEAIGRIGAAPDQDAAEPHPFTATTVLDGCLQLLGAALGTVEHEDAAGAYIPMAIRAVTLRRPIPPEVWARLQVRLSADARGAMADLQIVDADGQVVAELDGVEFRQTANLALSDVGARHAGTADAEGGESRQALVERLRALPADERLPVVVGWVTAEVSGTIGQAAEELGLDEIDPSMAFLEIGLDSLLVTELQRRIQEKLDFRFEAMEALDYQSIDTLAEFLLTDVLGGDLDASGTAAVPVASG
jgi:acyl transferase domain-containing protein/acyl carrier protein